ncbi:class I SAM-dependent methyltransferase [Shewanella salipaludis]|uniref:class I SAM-dependent methyltransferase n=1 Tax=Shewanella salipaludis TaxID=2723052 RepID=UPI0031403E65
MSIPVRSPMIDSFCELVSRPNAKVFEIACGPGNITRYLLNKRPDYQIHGIDLAPNMVALARSNNPEASFEVMDSRDISAIAKGFDAIICGFCTPYLSKSDVERLIKQMRDRVNIGGILYLSTMEDEDSRSDWQTSSAGDRVFIHYHQLEHLAQALTSNGFSIIKVQRKQFPVENGTPGIDLFIYAEAV